ncbi:glycoside hydrolase family 108 protein [Pelagerythrobacter marinus]|uniref:glycoside hydrolase family 108 protein n=1 Tax=Pelagerythrobacter marinus TaxID=538382 RepID=UPI002AC9A4D7|nr:glycosyl hydrolase 108 family protein [Pelagerythrobacter marinus]WPZ05475.1 glycosyl hydrolase 108 family protein [Pelagerythrobacter marinus]
MTVDEMIDGIIEREAGFVDHPSDPGGATRWGITQRVARKNGYHGDMRTLPQETAREIYKREYVAKPGFLGIAEIDPFVAEEVIDSGVNAGQFRAAKWFQQALNVLNRRGRDYADIAVDGEIGPRTLGAFKALRQRRGEAKARQLMLKTLNGLQFMHYYKLADGGTKFEDFFVGWIDHRVGAL